MHKILSIILLFLAVMAVSSAPAGKNWQSDPDWIKTRYGAWGGPGVDAAPGPMDAVELKNYAPKSSLALAETSVPKAKYPVIGVHTHVVARTPAEVQEWVRTMDEVGIDMSVVLTGATGEHFD